MYNYAATDSIFNGMSNIYVLSTATVILAVIIALYCANFLKDDMDVMRSTELENEQELEEDSSAHIEANTQSYNETFLVNYAENLEEVDSEAVEEEEQQHNESNVTALLVEETARNSESESDSDAEDIHTVDGLVGKIKSARLKELEAQLTMQQLEDERRIEREQLAAIFELLKKQEAELNMKEIDENELNAQLNLYR